MAWGTCCRAAVSLRDLGNVRLKDLSTPERVYQVVHPQLRQEFPALRSLEATPNNLPHQVTSFVGRESELAELQRLLARTRLLTLTGSGGCGKTRLACRLPPTRSSSFPDGAWLVELAPLADPDLVPQTVASVLGLKEEPGKPIAQTLVEHLEDKRLLLLLDNCEHLLDACAQLVDTLVRQCPRGDDPREQSRGARHRRRAGVPRAVAVACPIQAGAHAGVRRALRSGAAVHRSRAARPPGLSGHRPECCRARFHLPPAGRDSAGHRTGGGAGALPLGRRDQSQAGSAFPASDGGLAHGAAAAADAALADRLELRSAERSGERQVLQRLSVFAGGWTLEAAEQVCAGDGVADQEVLDLLASLCDKSLVLVEQNDEGYRYRLLETVRQYARERLLTSTGVEAVRARHRDCFLALAEETHAKLKGPEQAMWLQRLEAEHENLRASLEWSLADAGLNAGLRLCGALQYFWIMRGHFTEGRRWCDRILANTVAGARTPERANALNAAGLLAYRQDDYAAARVLLEESLAIRRQLGDLKGIGVAAGNLGMVVLDQGDFASARALHQESLAIARELGNRNGVLASLANLGNANYEQGDFADAQALFEESLAISRELEDAHSTAMTLHWLGMIEGAQGNRSAAEALYKESLLILRGLGLRGRIFYSMQALATVAAALGNPLRAARLWGAEERLREEIGLPRSLGELPEADPQIRDARAAVANGAAFDRAWQEGRALPIEQAIALALENAVERR